MLAEPISGSYGEAFARYDSVPHFEPEKVQKWRPSLSLAASLSGFHYEDHRYGHEYELIERIIGAVSTKLNNFQLHKFKMLHQINLVHCNFLEQVQNLSKAPNLTELYLDFCNNLMEIHDSVGLLDKLKILSAKSCVSLKIFPCSIKMKSLETLNLMCCSSLQYLPEVLGNMDKLSYLSLRETAIEELPCSIENVTGLFCLDLSFCQRLKKVPTCILMLPKLERLHFNKEARFQFIRNEEQKQVISTEKRICLGGCNFLDGFLPTFLGRFPDMTSLELCGSNLTILPECKQLQEIRAIPPKIKVLSARNCTSLIPSSLNLLLDENIHSRGITCFTLPGTRIPKWVDHYGKKASLSFWFRNKFPDVVQFVIGVNGRVLAESYHSYSELETKHAFLYNLRLHCDGDLEKHEMPYPEEEWNHAKISFVSKSYELGRRQEPLVQETGVYIFDRDRIERDILFTNPNTKQLG
ncbi:hypothetical protein L6164_002185 [Bauhinia variegata]|uniref:Uncharacterized protein n=1 Tax=Bauhinia variegata TaxID=167791 RepID=A0ACB9PWL6_BAUVA|nr:hypothetical protein L6164_002185 [Bauhinia variegata]